MNATVALPERTVPLSGYDVVVAGAGTAGVVAAIASARHGARTALVEAKGYAGGIVVEGGTALHSYYNLWKAFPGVQKRQVVAGIAQEIVDRLTAIGGCTGHCEMSAGFDYDSVCTAIDAEAYKLVAMEMLEEAGVVAMYNSFVAGASVEEVPESDANRITAALIVNRGGEAALAAGCFVDCTGYGDLAAHAGASFTEPNDHPVANSIGVGGVSLEGYHEFLERYGAIRELSRGVRSGSPDRIIRLHANADRLPKEFVEEARAIGMAAVTTTVHDDYFMFIKLNYRLDRSPTDPKAVSDAELELRRRQRRAVGLLRRFVPGCEHAFVARSSPGLSIRRGRCIVCDYDVTREDVLGGRHFEDDVLAYGFHDSAPRLQIADGGTYGVPYRALLVRRQENLLAAGMLITSDFDAHMSTRNTVCCMAQGEAAGTAAALAADRGVAPRSLDYATLRRALVADGVILEGGRS